jgi:hypothetical protein
MAEYKESRNIEKSCIEAIKIILLEHNYDNVEVVRTFKKVYEIPFDPKKGTAVICVRIGDTSYTGMELGSNLTMREPLILIDLFTSSDGQRLDLKDILISGLKGGFDYYEYTTIGGVTEDAYYDSGESSNGSIEVNKIGDTPLDFGINKSELDPHDRYRSLITLHCFKTKLEE